MALERKTSIKKYLIAFFLTLLIFSGGIVTGLFIENLRLSSAKQITLSEKVTLRSLQLQQNYISSGITDCKTLNTILETNIKEIEKKCPQNNIKVLYFYDENKDETQGDILIYLKKKFDNKLLIF